MSTFKLGQVVVSLDVCMSSSNETYKKVLPMFGMSTTMNE